MSTVRPDNIRPPPRSSTIQSLARPPIRSLSQDISQTHQTPQRQVSFDLATLKSLESPAKRPKLVHDGFLQRARDRTQIETIDLEALSAGISVETKAKDAPYKLPPFPSRPGCELQRAQLPGHSFTNNKEPVSEKPYILEAPNTTPRYADKREFECTQTYPVLNETGPADFFPWTGDKAEDTLNEHTIKNGYFDKAATPQNESTPARPTLWPKIRNKSGLEMLSSLFVMTLQQRQKFGAVSTISTFKPPPRATLTEPKREIWLKDLADSKIPLRRLSRTIPHGIRGKALLDQCMAKRIPLDRAIWLVKCVGANEIRAFKRKGPTILASGSEAKWVYEWTDNIQEFLNALIDSCGAQDWTDNSNYGFQLMGNVYAEGLLDKEQFLEWIIDSLQIAVNHKLPIWLLVTQMYWSEMALCRKFGKKLAAALCEQATLLHEQVVPANQDLWDKIWELMEKLMIESPACFLLPKQWPAYIAPLKAAASECMDTFEEIQGHNEELANFACMPQAQDPNQQIIDLLDAKDAAYDIKKTSRRCLSTCPGIVLLVTTTCRWATTIYRPGFANMYLALRLLRRWAKPDLNLEPIIFQFIRSCVDVFDLDKQKLFRFVAEFIRSKHISVSKYLQWIMAQGDPVILEKEVLLQAPLYDLPDHTRNLCQMVLDCQLPLDSAVSELQDTISSRLFNDAMVDEDLDCKPILTLRLPEQHQLAHWLRRLLLSHADAEGLLASFEDLKTICQILETMDDYAVFADALGVYAEIGHVDLLPVVLDALNMHFECFHAIGATEGICDTVLQRMEEVIDRSIAQKPLIMSLVDLVKRLPRRSRTLAVLQKELSVCEPKSIIAVCSPVSDAMGETQEDVTFFEEVEILFSSGSSMDRAPITRIFTDIVKRLEASWTNEVLTSISLVELLVRLKSFNGEVFSVLMPAWIDTILAGRQDVKDLLAILICGDLLDIQQLYIGVITQTTKKGAIPKIALVELLDLLLETPNIPRAYRLRADVISMVRNDPVTVARFLGLVLEWNNSSITSRPGFRELIQRLALHDPAVQSFFSKSKSVLLADLALGLPSEPGFIQSLPNILCYFNSKLCVGKLKQLLNEDVNLDLTNLPLDIIAKVMQEKQHSIEPWKEVLPYLPPPAALKMHKLIFSSFLENASETGNDADDALLHLLGIIQHNTEPQDLASTFTLLSDSLSKLQASLSKSSISDDIPISSLRPRLILLLRLLSIHTDVLAQAQIPSTTILHLCLNLTSLYSNPLLFSDRIIRHTLTNTITLLSDVLPNEIRQQTIHILHHHNIIFPQLDFLFGPPLQNSANSTLRLIPISNTDTTQHSKDKSKTVSSGQPSSAASSSLGTNSSKEPQSTSSSQPFTLHRWEMVQDATPVIGDNDTSLSLTFFGARKAVL